MFTLTTIIVLLLTLIHHVTNTTSRDDTPTSVPVPLCEEGDEFAPCPCTTVLTNTRVRTTTRRHVTVEFQEHVCVGQTEDEAQRKVPSGYK